MARWVAGSIPHIELVELFLIELFLALTSAPQLVSLVVEHWLEQEIAQWMHHEGLLILIICIYRLLPLYNI